MRTFKTGDMEATGSNPTRYKIFFQVNLSYNKNLNFIAENEEDNDKYTAGSSDEGNKKNNKKTQ